MNPKKVIVSGYATLDYVIQLSENFHGTGTALGELGASGAWPRAGGAALFASRRIAAAGHRAFALSWIGDDDDGGHYLRACQRAQICCEGIDQRRAVKTPRCVLVYRPDGDYGCLLDTGLDGNEALTSAQSNIIQQADHVCIAVGPPVVTNEVLENCPATTELSWSAKLDEYSYPKELRAKLARRAQIIFCNASEREFIEASFDGKRSDDQLIIETLGSAGVLIEGRGLRRVIPTTAIKAHDTTGAGDTLAGEVIAQLMTGQVEVDEAVKRGMAAARDLLASRGGSRIPE